jgi:hypothetical protein
MRNLLIALFVLFQASTSFGQKLGPKNFLDTNGKPINAHGGGFLYHNGTYYWYGEIKKGKTFVVSSGSKRLDAGGVSCYSSKDLKNWKYVGVALAPDKKNKNSDLHISKVIERPKVIYNKKTKKFVMWMHIDSEDYSYARSGVAVSNTPGGPFKYLGSVRPNGNIARDMTIFQDDDGKAYHFYSSEDNKTMHVALLSDDYLSHTKTDKRILIDLNREAPAVFKYKNKYYMVSSGLTGWAPNQAEYATADEILGDWKTVGNPCLGKDANITYFGQGTYVLPVKGKPYPFIFMADIWKEMDLEKSSYIWLPLTVSESGVVEIHGEK